MDPLLGKFAILLVHNVWTGGAKPGAVTVVAWVLLIAASFSSQIRLKSGGHTAKSKCQMTSTEALQGAITWQSANRPDLVPTNPEP
jgi:hypothetical protein